METIWTAVSGADGLVTQSLQQALDGASRTGGVVIVPAGEYLIGTVRIPPRVRLHLENGATLKASPNLDDFNKVGFLHNELGDVTSVLYARDAEDVQITGDGLIDLNGTGYFNPDEPIIPDDMRGRITDEQIAQCTWTHHGRVTQPIFFLRCKRVTVSGVRIENAPTWTCTFAECETIRVRDVIIRNHPNVPNNDGMHFCGCDGVVINGCDFVCADDCLAFTGITDWNVPCQNIAVSNCNFKSFSKAVVLGYMQSIVRNFTMTNVNIYESHRGFCIMSGGGEGLVENVAVTCCTIDTTVRAGNWWGNGEPICLLAVPHHLGLKGFYERSIPINIKRVVISSVVCASENCIGIIGDGRNISGVTLRDISVALKESRNIMLKGKVVDTSPATGYDTIPQDGGDYYLVVRGVSGLKLYNVTAEPFHDRMPKSFISDCDDVVTG